MPTTVVDLIRHGEPQGGHRYRGNRIDDPLSVKGWSQMWAAVGDYAAWDKIISSPLQRCHAFAKALSAQTHKPVLIESQFKEIGFGSWEGKTRAEIKQENLQEYDAFYRDPVNNRPEGAEVLGEFIFRVSSAYDAIVESHANQNILIVAHAGVIRAVLGHVLRASPNGIYNIKIDNAGVCRIKHSENHAVIDYINGKLG